MTISDPSAGSDDEYVRTVTAIGTAVARGDLRRAYEIADWALGRGMKGRVIYSARALALQASGRLDEALIDFRHALEFSPNDAGIHNAIGTTLDAQGQIPDAIKAFERSIALKADDPTVHYRRGQALGKIGNNKDAEVSYHHAVDLNPNYVEALANIASIAARSGQFDKARLYAERAHALSPKEALAHYALALVEMHERRHAEAEQRLRFLVLHRDIDPETRNGMHSLLGDTLDSQKRHAEAFEIYARGNEALKEQNAQRFQDGRGNDTIAHITSYFKNASPDNWKPGVSSTPPESGGPVQHVFLLGFIRSGTTLLEQVLASNPKVVALEEKSTLVPFSEKYMRSNEGLDALADIHGAALDEARREYWERVREHAESPIDGKILVDKQPLNTTRLPIIAKLFPDAKILFAIRDPRDVVFSCYRRPFQVTTTMFEFLDLEDAAKMYAAIMGLADIYREKISLNLMDHYYEDMVMDFETRVRAVCDFIGLEWSDSMRDFNKNAPVININSPSAKQVRRPLYGEGIGQWRRYAEQLQPMMPILRPWVERFGYSVE